MSRVMTPIGYQSVASARCVATVTRGNVHQSRHGGVIRLFTDKTGTFMINMPRSQFWKLYEYMTPRHLQKPLERLNWDDAEKLCKWLVGHKIKIRWTLMEKEEASNMFAYYDGTMMELVS